MGGQMRGVSRRKLQSGGPSRYALGGPRPQYGWDFPSATSSRKFGQKSSHHVMPKVLVLKARGRHVM